MACPSINDSSAMLLYEAPTGLAVFSFDGGCLNDPVESLEFFLKYEKVSTPIDLANEAIDDHLTRKLTRLCGCEKKLVVGSAEHKRIIEMKLGITCLYVGVPDCEVINCSLKNPMRALLPEGRSEANKMNRLTIGKELITVLRQHNFDVKPDDMAKESIAELAHQLHDTKLREMELLKFFSILLKDFIVISGIDTKRWMLFQFATVPKMICCPRSSYQIYQPVKIFTRVEYRKIEANASRYKTSFFKIGVLSVYEEVVSLHSKKCILLCHLDSLLEKTKVDIKIHKASTMVLYEAPFGIALFSFVGAYLNNSVKDFWADIPQLSLKEFIKCDKVFTLFDPAHEAIDDRLAKMLTRHCDPRKILVVGSAQHKTLIEKKLGITCLYVDVPDFEVINCSLKNPMRTLSPEEKSETNKMDHLTIGKELITLLGQHNFDVKPEMVNQSIAELVKGHGCRLEGGGGGGGK